ncbi:MAG: GNAT family N-acetyltransferase [Pseudomonadota bacterium]
MSCAAGVVREARANEMDRVRQLCRDYRALLAERATTPGFVAVYYGDDVFDELLVDLPRLHARPGGAILVFVLDGDIQGTVMTYEIAPQLAEIKRLYVAPSARGTGAGQRLLQAAVAQARHDGYARACLDTYDTLTEAIALYGKAGFSPCAPFYDPEPSLVPHLRFFDIML